MNYKPFKNAALVLTLGCAPLQGQELDSQEIYRRAQELYTKIGEASSVTPSAVTTYRTVECPGRDPVIVDQELAELWMQIVLDSPQMQELIERIGKIGTGKNSTDGARR
ncbi:hypothetical protein HY641_03920 [Candidatus Woesearchaeota archaeon]|nr:hypothetical protein [Candidatus Woesearchaeota archaeon]